MSAVAETAFDAAAGDRLARRNAIILAVAQALAGANNAVLVSTGAIIGAMLAPDRSFATVPISIYVLGMWMGTLPIGYLARHYGRRTSFIVGTSFGVLTGLVACAAVLSASFVLFCLAALFSGFYAAAHQSYRFAAADTASAAFRPKAISWVMVGGIFAAFFGPQLVIGTKDLWQPYLFAGTYLAQSVVQ
jgi:MFS family permease